MEHRGPYINHLSPSSVESAWYAVGSSTHLGSGDLSNGPIASERPYSFNEVNPRGRSEDVWAPVVCPPAGQVASGHSSGAQVGTHLPAHVPGRGIYGLCCTGKSGKEVTFSNGDMNRAQYVVSAPLFFDLSLVI